MCDAIHAIDLLCMQHGDVCNVVLAAQCFPAMQNLLMLCTSAQCDEKVYASRFMFTSHAVVNASDEGVAPEEKKWLNDAYYNYTQTDLYLPYGQGAS